jgi:uncharacterized membrane protein
MESLWVLLAFAFLTLPVVALILAIVALNRSRETQDRLEARVAGLEAALRVLDRRVKTEGPAPVVQPPPPPPPPSPPRPVVAAPAPAPMPAPAPAPEPKPALDFEQIVGGRWATWIGAVTLLFAVGFLLRWSFQNNLIGPAGRVAMGLAAGIALIAGGSYLRRRPPLVVLCDGMSGAGLGMLYLALFAAHRVYSFLDAGPAFLAMAGVTALGVALSVVTARQPVAILAVLGGLLTPILVATTRPDERVLMAYLIVLDLVVLGVARFRSWPWLNRLAWAGSALLVLPAIAKPGEPPHPAIRLALMSALFLLFVAVPLIRSWFDRVDAEPVDLALVAGNALAFFGAVYVTLERWGAERLEAYGAVVLGALYLGVAQYHAERVAGGDPPFTSLHRGLGAMFLAIAAPLAFDGPWVTLAWAALGVAFLVVSQRPGRGAVELASGAALLAGATARAAFFDPWGYPVDVPIWNVRFAVHAAVVAALAFAGTVVGRSSERTEAGDLRSLAWCVAAALAAVLCWRDPAVPWPAVLLGVEMLALAALARVKPDFAFAIATPVVGAVLLVRLFLEDGSIAWDQSVDLVNPQLGLRLAACAAIALAAVLLRPLADRPAFGPASRILAAAAPVVLWVTLSYAWWAHQQQLARVAATEVARRLRWLQQVGLSVLWTAYAAAALAVGFARALPTVRYAALGLLGITIAKVFLIDLSSLDAIYRILSFVVLGVVLLAIAYVYQRRGRTA